MNIVTAIVIFSFSLAGGFYLGMLVAFRGMMINLLELTAVIISETMVKSDYNSGCRRTMERVFGKFGKQVTIRPYEDAA